MNRNRKNLHKAAVNVLGFTLASVMAAGAVGEIAAPLSVFAAQTENTQTSRTVYLDGSETPTENADGSTQEKAVASLKKALELVGRQGEILVCGTVVIDSEVNLTIPADVIIKQAKGFEGKLFKITGKGTLLLTGRGISQEQVDTSSAEAGEKAFQIKAQEATPEEPEKIPEEEIEKPEKPQEPEVIPEEKPEEPKEPEAVPEEKPEEPKEPEKVPEEKPEEPKEPEVIPEEKPEEPKEPETVPEEKPEEPKEPEKVPEEKPEEPKEPEKVPEEKPEEPKEPEKIPEEETDQSEPETKKPGTVEVPEKLVFKTMEEFKSFDFSNNGFVGEGTFAWEEKTPHEYETQMLVRFTPDNLEEYDYTQTEGWENETKTVVLNVNVCIEEFRETDKSETQNQKPEEDSKDQEEEQKPEVIITPAEPETVPVEKPEAQKDEKPVNTAKPGKHGEVSKEIPKAIPVGSLIDESGVQVSADFLPFYVDLQVSYNDAVSELPDAGIGDILSAYELKLWDLKENTEYLIPEGKKVKVMIPLPENADCYSDLAIAHYLGNNEYEYFIFDKDGKLGNMTIEEKDGTEYLAFETASFSPFNVGGHQIVGPGINSNGHKPPVEQNSGTGTAGNTQGSGAGNAAGTNTGGNSQSGSASTQKKPNQTTSGGNNAAGTTVIRPVKTGDSTETVVYVALGAGALVLGLGAAAAGKKKE